MPAGAASRYALGADGVGAARPAPAANPDLRLALYALAALGARRCAPRALRAEGAARLCAGPPRAAQPLAAIAASRYALGADGVWALRARAPAAARSPPARYALGAEGVWAAARPGAYMCSPPITARVASWE